MDCILAIVVRYFFIVRNTDDGRINERVCPCCGVCSDNAIEPVEVVD